MTNVELAQKIAIFEQKLVEIFEVVQKVAQKSTKHGEVIGDLKKQFDEVKVTVDALKTANNNIMNHIGSNTASTATYR